MSMVRPVMIVLCLLLLLCFSTILSEAIRERGYDLHKSVLRSLPLALRNSTLTSVVEHSGHVKALVNARVEAFLRVVAPLSGIWLWLAPLPTLRRAQRIGTTGGLTPLPYFAMLANGWLWTCYGTTVGWDPTILVPNFACCVSGLYYCRMFAHCDSGHFPFSRYAFGAAVVCATVTAVACSLPERTAQDILGCVGMGSCVLMFAGPLQVMRAVIRARSTRDLPFPMTLATLANTSLWAAFGFLVARDPYIYWPNVLGLVSAAVQLGLFAAYGFVHVPPSSDTDECCEGKGTDGKVQRLQLQPRECTSKIEEDSPVKSNS